MTDVRSVTTTPDDQVFRSKGGTPIVVDRAAKKAYALGADGAVFNIADTSITATIDDTPVNGETAHSISSNWAFDHVAAADPHTVYRLESADHNHQSTGAQAGQLDHGLALTGLTDDDHSQYLLASQATDRATFTANWSDLTDGGDTTLHTHSFSGVTGFDEAAQDAVGGILTDTATVNFTYDDATPQITADVIQSALDHGSIGGLSDNDHPQYLLVADIDDTPVNGEVAQPISSNWAFDHLAAADPHPGYLTPAEGNAAYQPLDAGLTDIAGLAVTDGNIIVGNGANWVAESGDTARTSLGIGTGDSPEFTGLTVSGLTATRVPFATTGGQFTDDAGFTFNTTGDILTVGAINVAGSTAPTSGWYLPSADLIRTPNSVTIDDQLVVSGSGPHAIGTSPSSRWQFNLGGSYTAVGSSPSIAFLSNTNLTPASDADAAGVYLSHGITRVGTNNIVANLYVDQLALSGAGTAINGAGIYVNNAPTGAANNYSLWSVGSVRIDGTTGAGASVGTLGNAPSAGDPDKWIPINSDGTQYWFPAWAS